jgi:hypothetical protein
MKKLFKKIAPWLLMGSTLLSFPCLALAAEGGTTDISLEPPEGWGKLKFEIPDLVAGLLRIILVIAAIVFFIMLLIGGIQWMVSGGDKAATETARGKITAALVGLVIIFAAWAIAALINNFFGIDIFKLQIKPIT